jgi:ribosome modulation factor
MLATRCKSVFDEFSLREEQDENFVLDRERLLLAFHQGTLAAKARRDVGHCPFSAVTEQSEFLAWLEGFRCCSASR